MEDLRLETERHGNPADGKRLVEGMQLNRSWWWLSSPKRGTFLSAFLDENFDTFVQIKLSFMQLVISTNLSLIGFMQLLSKILKTSLESPKT